MPEKGDMWLIQRRRLHDAVEALKAGESSVADMAARHGYADQAHFLTTSGR